MLKFCLLLCLFSLNLQATDYHARFESFEHAAIGDNINLLGINGKLLHLPNGLTLSFGNIIAMPDFYGIPGSPISDGASERERETRFLAAYKTLANDQNSIQEAMNIIAAIHVLKPGEDQNLQWNCLTGGACSGSSWWLEPGRYLSLAKTDYDHFGSDAIKTYLAGHQVALKKALEGNLEQAYAMDAFACHFLTDRFSSGHMRTPRRELADNVTPSVIGSLLANFMHNEECTHGLHVHNQQGDRWIAYGDGHYLDAKNKDNFKITQEAVQLSANDIYQAFSNRQLPTTYQQLALIPEADESGSNATLDIAPLFYWDSATSLLMRRVNLNNLNDYQWTSDWVGWSTLAALKISNRSTSPR
ncbi:MAG: hypothetical protein WCK49_04715 [Myxococcaceae bacterium]